MEAAAMQSVQKYIKNFEPLLIFSIGVINLLYNFQKSMDVWSKRIENDD